MLNYVAQILRNEIQEQLIDPSLLIPLSSIYQWQYISTLTAC